MATIGGNVERIRKREDLTQSQMAEKLMRSSGGWIWNQKAVSRLENERVISMDQLESLLEILGPEVVAGTPFGDIATADFTRTQNQAKQAEMTELAAEMLSQAEALSATAKRLMRLAGQSGSDDGIDQTT